MNALLWWRTNCKVLTTQLSKLPILWSVCLSAFACIGRSLNNSLSAQLNPASTEQKSLLGVGGIMFK